MIGISCNIETKMEKNNSERKPSKKLCIRPIIIISILRPCNVETT